MTAQDLASSQCIRPKRKCSDAYLSFATLNSVSLWLLEKPSEFLCCSQNLPPQRHLMPPVCVKAPHSACIKQGKREKAAPELEETELVSALLQFFPYFYMFWPGELLLPSATPLPCKKDATMTQTALDRKYTCNDLLLRREEPALLGRKVSHVRCAMCTLLWGGSLLLYVTLQAIAKILSLVPVFANFDRNLKSCICAKIQYP